ncbi:MAG: helix-turn-helix domain-containing protein [Actinophytocola sp.]|nr:helix-turn-helix domain-containing protein [Actinophytocola sp.]
MLKSVAVVVFDGVGAFELGVLCEVFGQDRSDENLPNFDFRVCAAQPGQVATSSGFSVLVQHGLDAVETADLVAVPAMPGKGSAPDDVLKALRTAHDGGARVLSMCTGAFVLGDAGLLDGRRCTTHWLHTTGLAEQFPLAEVDQDVLYVDEGAVITSAGTAAGIDACLHLMRTEFGASVASRFARRMVVPPHREGGQAQYIDQPVPGCDAETLAPLLTWLLENLDQRLSVEDLAAKALMSPRTFARRFRAETGTTPHQWLVSQRLLAAQRLLEDGDTPIDDIARATGFGNATALRHHFTRWRGTTPQHYRRTFRGTS